MADQEIQLTQQNWQSALSIFKDHNMPTEQWDNITQSALFVMDNQCPTLYAINQAHRNRLRNSNFSIVLNKMLINANSSQNGKPLIIFRCLVQGRLVAVYVDERNMKHQLVMNFESCEMDLTEIANLVEYSWQSLSANFYGLYGTTVVRTPYTTEKLRDLVSRNYAADRFIFHGNTARKLLAMPPVEQRINYNYVRSLQFRLNKTRSLAFDTVIPDLAFFGHCTVNEKTLASVEKRSGHVFKVEVMANSTSASVALANIFSDVIADFQAPEVVGFQSNITDNNKQTETVGNQEAEVLNPQQSTLIGKDAEKRGGVVKMMTSTVLANMFSAVFTNNQAPEVADMQLNIADNNKQPEVLNPQLPVVVENNNDIVQLVTRNADVEETNNKRKSPEPSPLGDIVADKDDNASNKKQKTNDTDAENDEDDEDEDDTISPDKLYFLVSGFMESALTGKGAAKREGVVKMMAILAAMSGKSINEHDFKLETQEGAIEMSKCILCGIKHIYAINANLNVICLLEHKLDLSKEKLQREAEKKLEIEKQLKEALEKYQL